MERALASILNAIEALEDYDPKTDSGAYVRRELIALLDKGREMAKCLAEDEGVESARPTGPVRKRKGSK